MNCKFCGAQLNADDDLCPNCGKRNSDELLPETPETAEQNPETEIENEEKQEVAVPEEAPTSEPAAESQPAPKQKKGAVIGLSVACAALAIALGLTIFYLVNGGWKLRSNDLYYRDSYSAEAMDAQKKSDKVVATMSGHELTNGQLQIYYWTQVYEYLDYWGNNTAYFGLDYTKPFDQQLKQGTDMTWQQYFLDLALNTWQRYQVLNILADKENFVMGEEYQKALDLSKSNMETLALQNNFATADALLQSEMGPGCDMDDYMNYLERYYRGYQYFEKEFEKLSVTDEEVETYFEEHIGDYEEMGVTKETGLVSDVRHILIAVEGQEKDENGNPIYSDADWEACRAKAQALLDQWKSGEATEESFAALVADNTADGGSASNGGLYQNVTFDSNYVEPFRDWATDSQRKPGDCELVKTPFGYHIMYFVKGEDTWFTYAKSSLLTEKSKQLVDAAVAENPMTVNYKNIVLGEVKLGA